LPAIPKCPPINSEKEEIKICEVGDKSLNDEDCVFHGWLVWIHPAQPLPQIPSLHKITVLDDWK
jgi:hypothetical protein